MYTKYIIYSFSTATGLHVYDSWNITKQKKIEKIIQFPSIKSPPFWYGSDFFLKKDIIMHSLLKVQKKHIFWMEFHPKTWNFKIVLDLIDAYQYHTP
jgi:hypothetical protein